MRTILPILTVIVVLVGFWYAAVVPMNIKGALTQAERAGVSVTPDTALARRDADCLLYTSDAADE